MPSSIYGKGDLFVPGLRGGTKSSARIFRVGSLACVGDGRGRGEWCGGGGRGMEWSGGEWSGGEWGADVVL